MLSHTFFDLILNNLGDDKWHRWQTEDNKTRYNIHCLIVILVRKIRIQIQYKVVHLEDQRKENYFLKSIYDLFQYSYNFNELKILLLILQKMYLLCVWLDKRLVRQIFHFILCTIYKYTVKVIQIILHSYFYYIKIFSCKQRSDSSKFVRFKSAVRWK